MCRFVGLVVTDKHWMRHARLQSSLHLCLPVAPGEKPGAAHDVQYCTDWKNAACHN